MSVPGLNADWDVYVPGFVKDPNGNTYSFAVLPASLNWTELPLTLLGSNTTAGTSDDTMQFAHEFNWVDSNSVSAVIRDCVEY